MISRMRKSHTQHRRSLLFYLVLGLLLNIVIAYSCGGLAGALGFSYSDGAYGDWDLFIESEDGWASNGTAFGISGWLDEYYVTDPSDFYSDDMMIVSEEGGTIYATRSSGNRIGWPLQCIQHSQKWIEVTRLRSKAESKDKGRVIAKTDTEITPTPHWYFKGIKTNLKNSIFYQIPVQIRPLQFLVNTLFYSIVLYAIHLLIVRLKQSSRHRQGLCVGCGYAIEDLNVCPECGSDHAAC